MANRLIVVRGTTPQYEIAVVDKSTQAAFDLTGFTMYFTVKKGQYDADADAIIGPVTATISSPTTGVGTVGLSVSDTTVPEGLYWYDVRITDADEQYVVVGPSKSFEVVQNIKDIV